MKIFNSNRKLEKEIEKQIKEQEDEIEKELPPEDKVGIKEIFELLKTKSEDDIEYESLLTEEELKQEKDKEKEEKKILIIAISVMATALCAAWIFVNIYYNANKSDLLKITQPMLEEYYNKKYNSKVKITSIEELTVKDENNNDVPTGIVLATTKDNKHLMTINNEIIGDDISISNINEEFLNYMNTFVEEGSLIYQSVDLSYKDYYLNYNRFYEYIYTLPDGYNLTKLFETNKLTANYRLVYQGQLDLTNIYNTLNMLSDDSKFYLIKQEVGLPVNLTVVTKEKTYAMDITTSIEKEKNIIYYELSREVNGVSVLNLGSILDPAIEAIGDYNITNVYTIDFEEIREYGKEETKPTYYLLKFNNKNINHKNVKQVNTNKNYNGYYPELEIDEYKDIVLIEFGGSTYLIAQEKLAFGTKTNKKSPLCNLGIC